MKRSKPIDTTGAFEAALTAKPSVEQYCLRLYITGSTPRCARAITNIRAICEANLAGRYDLEVIDLYQHPEMAKPEQIVVTPTLVKQRPLPSRRLIGDLSDEERVLAGLDLVKRPVSAKPPGSNHGT